jgi:hypothetical protein
MSKITVIVKEPSQAPEVRTIENTLESLQGIVGGYIEVVSFTPSVLMICNEEGKLDGLPHNFSMRLDEIVGSVLFVSSDGEDFASLTESQRTRVIEYFSQK